MGFIKGLSAWTCDSPMQANLTKNLAHYGKVDKHECNIAVESYTAQICREASMYRSPNSGNPRKQNLSISILVRIIHLKHAQESDKFLFSVESNANDRSLLYLQIQWIEEQHQILSLKVG